MKWNGQAEQAVLGFIGYGAASLTLSPGVLHFIFTALSGALVGFGYAYLRPLPWRRYFLSKSKQACVSVDRKLRFREVSTKTPAGSGFIRFEGLEKKDLFARLDGKQINRNTIPFHWRVILEEGRDLEIPWDAFEPHLIGT